MNATRVPFTFVRLDPPAPGEPRVFGYDRIEGFGSDRPTLCFQLRTTGDESFFREFSQALANRDAKDFANVMHLHPNRPIDARELVADMTDAIDDDALLVEFEAAMREYGFFDWNPATKRFDLQIDPRTGEPVNA
jgi:hypothetical protein